MNKREHFECLMKQLRPNMPLDYNEQEGYYYHDMVSLAYQAYTASPKKRPTEPGKITKEQLAAMKADTTDIVDHLRGIYAGAASRYPVTPLMLKAADEIERLFDAASQAHSLLGELLAEATGDTEKEIYRVFDLLRYTLGIYTAPH